VDAVWCDTRTEDAAQAFVLWAGAVLGGRDELRAALRGRAGGFGFSLLAHADHGSPMLDFLPTSSVLQVRRRGGGVAGDVPAVGVPVCVWGGGGVMKAELGWIGAISMFIWAWLRV
jgi:hypothetical protein